MATPLSLTPSADSSSFFSAAGQSSGLTHTVSSGDTLSEIAQTYGVSLQELIAANPQIANPNRIYPGDEVNVPAGTYEIQAGDTLSSIADRLGTTVSELVDANDIANPDLIFAGDVLVVPGASAAPPAPAPEPGPARHRHRTQRRHRRPIQTRRPRRLMVRSTTTPLRALRTIPT